MSVDPALRELYQEVILDHSKHPRNFHALSDPTHSARGENPLCGDRLRLFLDVSGGVIRDVGFQGAGCAISTASASLMSEILKGKSQEEAEKIFSAFHDLVTGKGEDDTLGKLAVFAGVRDYPVRVKCATLAWHTMRAALEHKEEAVSTE